MARLTELTGQRRRFAIDRSIVIGRDPLCDVHLVDPRVSRRHAQVTPIEGGRYQLVDLGSTQGTYVAGRRVDNLVLCHGDELRVGGVTLRFEDLSSLAKSIDRVVLSPSRAEGPLRRVPLTDEEVFIPASATPDAPTLRRDYERLRAALEIHEATMEEDDPGRLLRAILGVALRVLAADRAAIVLFDESGIPVEQVARARAGLAESFEVPRATLEEVRRDRVAVLTTEQAVGTDDDLRSTICVPMVAEGRCQGVLCLEVLSAGKALSEHDLDVCTVLGRHGASALRQAAMRDRLRSQAVTEERVSLLERLAGGLAHRLNNSLNVILGTLELLGPKLGESHGAELSDIHAAVADANELTRELLALSRRGPHRPSPFPLDDLVRDLATLLPSPTESPRLVTHLDAKDYDARADRALIQQAVASVLRFALENAGPGGEVTVETKAQTAEQATVSVDDTEPPKPCPEILLRIHDHGPALDVARARRVFDPFSEGPLAPAGSGGLALAAAYAIAHQTGGSLKLHAQAGEGNIFTFVLPAEPLQRLRPEPSTRRPRPRTDEGRTILLVDDDEIVLRVTRRSLERSGFHVLAAKSGLEALELFAGAEQNIDAVVSDVLMPGMTGPELVRGLRARRADLPALFVSGYSDTSLAAGDLAGPATDFLAKPFEPTELASRLALLLPKN